MSLPDWVKSDAWDTVILGGKKVPGIAKVKARAGSGLEHKKPKGGKKATTKDDGDPLAEFDVDVSMDHADLVEFSDMIGVLRPVTKGGARSPLKAVHPQFALFGVFNVSIGKIEVDHPESGGRIQVSIEVVEWAPAPTAVTASKKKPDDGEDRGAWLPFAEQQAGRFFSALGGKADDTPQKPSSNAGKNI